MQASCKFYFNFQFLKFRILNILSLYTLLMATTGVFLSSHSLSAMFRPLVKSAYQKINFLFYKYVMDSQKKRLNETVLLSTQNICSN